MRKRCMVVGFLLIVALVAFVVLLRLPSEMQRRCETALTGKCLRELTDTLGAPPSAYYARVEMEKIHGRLGWQEDIAAMALWWKEPFRGEHVISVCFDAAGRAVIVKYQTLVPGPPFSLPRFPQASSPWTDVLP